MAFHASRFERREQLNILHRIANMTCATVEFAVLASEVRRLVRHMIERDSRAASSGKSRRELQMIRFKAMKISRVTRLALAIGHRAQIVLGAVMFAVTRRASERLGVAARNCSRHTRELGRVLRESCRVEVMR